MQNALGSTPIERKPRRPRVTMPLSSRARPRLGRPACSAGLRADELLADRRQHPLPRGVTPHKLRHTYASVLIALGRDPRYVMEQLGHTDPKFTLRVYAHAMRFSEEDRARLKAFAEGRGFGTNWHWHP